MFKKVLAVALTIVMCLGVSTATWADEPKQPSFEVKAEIEIEHYLYQFNQTSKPITLLASNELIAVIEGEGYGYPAYVFPVDTVITFRNYTGSPILYGAWIEADGKALFELDEIILISEYIGKTVSLEGTSGGVSVFVSVATTDLVPAPIPETTLQPTPEPTPEITPQLTQVPTTSTTPAVTQVHDTGVVANCYFVNLRSGAGVSHAAFNYLAVGDTVTVIDQKGGWYKVATNKGTGWIYGAYLNINGN